MKKLLILLAGTILSSYAFSAHNDRPVNNAITNSVTQSNTKVLGDAPAVSVGNTYQNEKCDANCQIEDNQQQQIEGSATTTEGVSHIYSQ